MIRQIVVAVLALVILIAAVAMSRATPAPAAAAKPDAAKPAPLRTVGVRVVKNESIRTSIPLYGRLSAVEKIEVLSEVSGAMVANSPVLRAGLRFGKGDVLLRVDATELTLSLQAQRAALLTAITQIMPDIKIDFSDNLAAWEDYLRKFDVTKPLAELPAAKSEREKNFVALKTIYNQFYSIKSGEERLTKYTLRAPFGGEIMESAISTGSYIRAGQRLAVLMNTGNYELEASVSLEDLAYIKTGDKVSLRSEDGGTASWTGRIARISSTVDTRTQSIKIYIQVSGTGLRENMFLTGEVEANALASVVELPRRLLVDGDKIYTFQPADSSLRLQPVQIMRTNQNTVFLRGLPDGTQALAEPFTGIYEGIKVRVQ